MNLFYLTLLQIIVPTLLAIFNCIFFLMSHGWGTTTFDVYRTNRPACMKVITLGAILYLLMFMKNLGADSASIKNLVIVCDMGIYCYLLYYSLINIQEKLAEVKRLEEDEEVPDAH